jgi:hypothetical protein
MIAVNRKGALYRKMHPGGVEASEKVKERR